MVRKMYRRKRMSGKVPSKRKAIRKAVRTVQNARIKAVIKETLGRQVETKVLQTAGTLYARPFESAMTTPNFNSCVMCLTPQGNTLGGWTGGAYPILASSIAQDGRIGDEVKMKGTYFNYQVIPQVYNVSTNPIPSAQIVTLFFIKPKIKNAAGLSPSEILSGSDARFFENQSNADSGFTGSLIDLLRKVDRDNFQVIKVKQHKIGFAGTMNTTNVVSTLQNNDFKAYARGRVKIGSYNWKVDRQDQFEGRNIFVFCVSHRADGTSVSSTQIPVIVNFNLAHYYSDM